jgi:iron-sulfur cluster repair protein YtfE (RIC family)
MASPRVHTQRLRDEHREFLPHIEMLRTAADLLGAAGDEEARAALDDVGPFLATRLAPHMVAEDEVLYPLLEEAMGVPCAAITGRSAA